MRIIQKSILTEAAAKDTAINEILKYSRTQLHSQFDIILGSTGDALRNSYTIVYWNNKHKVPEGDTSTSRKVNDTTVTNSAESLVNRLNDASDSDVFLFLLWKNGYTADGETYTFGTEGAKNGCPSGVILATYFKKKLYTKTNLGCIWNKLGEDKKTEKVYVHDTYTKTELAAITGDCSVVIKLKSGGKGDTSKSGSTIDIKNYLLDKYVKGFNEMLLFAGEVKKNFTNDFKNIYENAQSAFDKMNAQYQDAIAKDLPEKERKAYEGQLHTINGIIDSLESWYFRLNRDKTVDIQGEGDYHESLITEAAINSQNKIRREKAKALMKKVKQGAETTTDIDNTQSQANSTQEVKQAEAQAKQAKAEAQETVPYTDALIDLPEFITKCIRTWKRINLYYNREATIRSVASHDELILLGHEDLFKQFPSEPLYNAEQALEKLYNDLYNSNGIMEHLRALYEKSKTDDFKSIYITYNGKKTKLSDIKFDKVLNLHEIISIGMGLADYVKRISKLDELKQLNTSLKELNDKYFKDGKILSNAYFENHNKILKDIEGRLSARNGAGTTVNIKSVDAMNANVVNQ